MSRASKRKRKLNRAAQYANSSGYNNTVLQGMIAQLNAQMKKSNDVLYSPGLPLQPQVGVNPQGVPRQWSFPLVINTSGVDRSMGNPDIPSFKQLRLLAKMYSGITLPERVWLDMVHGLKLNIGLKASLKAQGMDDKDVQKPIAEILEFFEKPDKQHDMHSWLKMMIRDQTQIDEMYLYKRRARDGSLYALEVVDGSTIKPILDDWGRVPEPPLYAYQQFPWGLPGELWTTDELIHYQETPQSDMPYGFGRVERFMMEVNQALRKKKRDLAMFTEGNIPTGIMEVPDNAIWTPDQIESMQALWNALTAGNAAEQVRVRFTQPGMKYTKLDSGEILTDFDYFLYKISCGVYGISLADIGFVEDIHKSSDQGQQNMMYRRTLQPIVSVYAEIITRIIRDEFHEDRLEVSFSGYEEEEDFNTQATGYQILANIGAIAPSDVAHLMRLPDVPKTGPFIMTKDGPFFLKDYEEGSDVRNLTQQSKVAGLQFAASNPGGPPKESPLQGEDNDKNSGVSARQDGSSNGQNDNSDGRNDRGGSKSDGKQDNSGANGGNDRESNGANSSNKSGGNGNLSKDERGASGKSSEKDSTDNNRRAELKRWRTRALYDVERGRGIRPFESDILSSDERIAISAGLSRCKSAEDVRGIFNIAFDRDTISAEIDRCRTMEDLRSIFNSFSNSRSIAGSEDTASLERDTRGKAGGSGNLPTQSSIDWSNAPLF